MGAHFSSVRKAFQGFQDAKSRVLALSEICEATGIRTDEYELALELYTRYKDLCRRACWYLVNYYNTWMYHAKMMLIILRALEENRNRMTHHTLETCRKLICHRSDILCFFDMPGGIRMVIPQVLVHFEANESDALSTAISQVLAELDLTGDGNRGAVEDDTTAAVGEQVQNQDLPDTDSEKN